MLHEIMAQDEALRNMRENKEVLLIKSVSDRVRCLVEAYGRVRAHDRSKKTITCFDLDLERDDAQPFELKTDGHGRFYAHTFKSSSDPGLVHDGDEILLLNDMLAMDMDFDCATSLVSNGLCSTVTVLRDVASGNSTDRHAYRRLELKRTAQTLEDHNNPFGVLLISSHGKMKTGDHFILARSEQCPVQPGDVLKDVNGIDAVGKSHDEVAKLLHTQKHPKVYIVVFRNGLHDEDRASRTSRMSVEFFSQLQQGTMLRDGRTSVTLGVSRTSFDAKSKSSYRPSRLSVSTTFPGAQGPAKQENLSSRDTEPLALGSIPEENSVTPSKWGYAPKLSHEAEMLPFPESNDNEANNDLMPPVPVPRQRSNPESETTLSPASTESSPPPPPPPSSESDQLDEDSEPFPAAPVGQMMEGSSGGHPFLMHQAGCTREHNQSLSPLHLHPDMHKKSSCKTSIVSECSWTSASSAEWVKRDTDGLLPFPRDSSASCGRGSSADWGIGRVSNRLRGSSYCSSTSSTPNRGRSHNHKGSSKSFIFPPSPSSMASSPSIGGPRSFASSVDNMAPLSSVYTNVPNGVKSADMYIEDAIKPDVKHEMKDSNTPEQQKSSDKEGSTSTTRVQALAAMFKEKQEENNNNPPPEKPTRKKLPSVKKRGTSQRRLPPKPPSMRLKPKLRVQSVRDSMDVIHEEERLTGSTPATPQDQDYTEPSLMMTSSMFAEKAKPRPSLTLDVPREESNTDDLAGIKTGPHMVTVRLRKASVDAEVQHDKGDLTFGADAADKIRRRRRSSGQAAKNAKRQTVYGAPGKVPSRLSLAARAGRKRRQPQAVPSVYAVHYIGSKAAEAMLWSRKSGAYLFREVRGNIVLSVVCKGEVSHHELTIKKNIPYNKLVAALTKFVKQYSVKKAAFLPCKLTEYITEEKKFNLATQ
eukprot:m.231963 g.231963  ORF g.231963 m.231963 type:complete len:923 (-) comp16014_c0_seq6:124-2892(-)